MTSEFESLINDPDIDAERGPGRTLIFIDGEQYCVVGPDFMGVESGQGIAFGRTRAEALTNYSLKFGK